MSVRRLRASVGPEELAFAARTAAATLLSLWIAFRWQFTNPYLGAVTIWLVAKPGIRATMAVSVARLIGTIIGSLGGVVIMALVAQAPETALVLIALWLAVCAAGATLSLVPAHTYTFQLAGFAILTEVAAAIPDPSGSFLFAVNGCAGVCVGVASIFLIDALFPYGIEAPPPPPPPRTKATVVAAARNAAIAAAAVLVAGMFWMATAWPDGVYFLFAAGLVAVFFAPTLTPDIRALEWAQGVLAAGLISALYTYAILPHHTAFPGFALTLAPVLLLGGVGVTIPPLAAGGVLIAMAFLFILMQPTNAQRIDPVILFNRDIAYVLGGVMGTVMFRLFGRSTLR
jgi:uncharacterized membrane protein YccC